MSEENKKHINKIPTRRPISAINSARGKLPSTSTRFNASPRQADVSLANLSISNTTGQTNLNSGTLPRLNTKQTNVNFANSQKLDATEQASVNLTNLPNSSSRGLTNINLDTSPKLNTRTNISSSSSSRLSTNSQKNMSSNSLAHFKQPNKTSSSKLPPLELKINQQNINDSNVSLSKNEQVVELPKLDNKTKHSHITNISENINDTIKNMDEMGKQQATTISTSNNRPRSALVTNKEKEEYEKVKKILVDMPFGCQLLYR